MEIGTIFLIALVSFFAITGLFWFFTLRLAASAYFAVFSRPIATTMFLRYLAVSLIKYPTIVNEGFILFFDEEKANVTRKVLIDELSKIKASYGV